MRSEGSITEKVITGAITGKIHHEVGGVNPVGHSVDIYDVIIYYVISGCQCGHQSFFTITPISDEFMELGSGNPWPSGTVVMFGNWCHNEFTELAWSA